MLSEPPTPGRWPTDVGAHIHTLAAQAASQNPPTLRIGAERIPLLGRARVYVCGITPYDTTHVGHAATFVWADLAARVFRLSGVEVEVCRNITDVDDHLLAEARTKKVSWRALAAEQTYRFERDMAELGVVHPTYEPRSFDHVDDVITLVAELLATEAAYERDGNVYFRGTDVHRGVGLSRQEALDLAGERGGCPDDPKKQDPLDSVMWQRSVGDEPAWESPWGQGRPGWHVECSAMALSTLGPTMDLHVGGEDLEFPHHAYEAAQAEAFTGVRPFSRSWVHVGSVMIEGRKMAKSSGNLVFAHDLLERFGPAPIRLLLLDRRWRDPWEFDEASLDQASDELEHLFSLSATPSRSPNAGTAVVAALTDDLDVPRAFAIAKEAGGEPLRNLMGFLGLI